MTNDNSSTQTADLPQRLADVFMIRAREWDSNYAGYVTGDGRGGKPLPTTHINRFLHSQARMNQETVMSVGCETTAVIKNPVMHLHQKDASQTESSGVVLQYDFHMARNIEDFHFIKWLCGKCQQKAGAQIFPADIRRDEYGAKTTDLKCQHCEQVVELNMGG